MAKLSRDVYAFLSYVREDKPFADRLANDLRQAGVRIWRDVDDILPGTQWQKEIEKALAQSFTLLYVSSKNTPTSGWMAKELEFFLEKRAERVIPIILDH